MSIPACKWLRHKKTGRLFAWSKYLAEREEEFEISKEGPVAPDLTNRERDNAPDVGTGRMTRIVEAIESLDPEEDFDKRPGRAGGPKMAALIKVFGEDVSLEERNAAWAVIQGRAKKATT